MAVLIRTAFCVALPFLLLQLQTVRCEDTDVSELEPKRTEPLSWDELQYTRLQEVNTVARKISDIVKKGNNAENPLTAAATKIRPLRSAASIDNVLNEAISSSGNGVRPETEKVNSLICSTAQRFKRMLKSVISLAELIADSDRPEFLEIMKADNAQDDEQFKVAVQSLTSTVKDQKQAPSDIISREVKEDQYPTNLYGRKTLAYKKLHVLDKHMKSELNTVGDGANYALNSIYNGMIATKNIQRELKSTQEYPENMGEEEANIKKALAVAKALGCGKDRKETEKPSTDLPEKSGNKYDDDDK